ncbi:5-oxoprolinase (ATP-hydrolyzing) [Natronolimnohabitans innermongolicus JCM 12255]|uniref:5-oxoprolinase (ATP-hydrolyzing) n=1 Tax=Natronolimnohabitans innermongolicus JCM 12255 TaxID=1227499 RepID=L9WYI1_9EURY|nr:5-oxoprolinase (ATP-hydrolyzing) [Natronolimnohabitans innermongolicus JCM 12255]
MNDADNADGRTARRTKRTERTDATRVRTDGGTAGTADADTDAADASAATRIGVDVGGTFTDVALSVDDSLVTAKVPSTTPQHLGVLEGLRKACDDAGIDPAEIDEFAHAMTAVSYTHL